MKVPAAWAVDDTDASSAEQQVDPHGGPGDLPVGRTRPRHFGDSRPADLAGRDGTPHREQSAGSRAARGVRRRRRYRAPQEPATRSIRCASSSRRSGALSGGWPDACRGVVPRARMCRCGARGARRRGRPCRAPDTGVPTGCERRVAPITRVRGTLASSRERVPTCRSGGFRIAADPTIGGSGREVQQRSHCAAENRIHAVLGRGRADGSWLDRARAPVEPVGQCADVQRHGHGTANERSRSPLAARSAGLPPPRGAACPECRNQQ